MRAVERLVQGQMMTVQASEENSVVNVDIAVVADLTLAEAPKPALGRKHIVNPSCITQTF